MNVLITGGAGRAGDDLAFPELDDALRLDGCGVAVLASRKDGL